MKSRIFFLFLLLVVSVTAFSQSRRSAVHRRGLLHQTVFNTGEIGRAYDNGTSGSTSSPCFEWPGNSAVFVDGTPYNGKYNSFGAGFWISGYKNRDGTTNYTDQCGAVSDINGKAAPVSGAYSVPISIERIENYPVLANGNLNGSYNPDQAEEIIIAKWTAINTGVTITRTSYAWSYPDYDDFIIYEYEIANPRPTDPSIHADTLKDVIVAWPYVLGSSMFGYQRRYVRWLEEDTRAKDQFARYDFKRYMTYNHYRDGDPDQNYFDTWSSTGKYGGGLNSPAAVGLVLLYYDWNPLINRGQATTDHVFYDRQYITSIFENNGAATGKMKQPYINRYENGNLYPSKVGASGFLDCKAMRKSTPYSPTGAADTTIGAYWSGRASPSWTIGSRQPACHIYGVGPYYLYPDSTLRFAVAEVAGFGAAGAADSLVTDLGGGCGSDGTDPDPGTHRVASWYREISYPEAKTPGSTGTNMGSNYLQNYPMPSYVNSNVISVRDVADRAIQMYKGGPVINYSRVSYTGTSKGLGYEPKNAPRRGLYQVNIPVPAPAIIVENTDSAKNIISWNNNVESFTTPRLNAPLSYYKVEKAPHPLGPWTLIDSVGKADSRYYDPGTRTYTVKDRSSLLSESYYYSVVTVDTTGGKSGRTNMNLHETQRPAADPMTKVYVVPNPLIVSSGSNGASPEGDINDRIGFYGLPKKATIRIFSYSGQLINTIEHNVNLYSVAWYQVTRNNQRLASGVYFFTVDDHTSGKRVHGKFVVIH